VLPTLWFRNTWTWWPEQPKPGLREAIEIFGKLDAQAFLRGGRQAAFGLVTERV
jgi:hypothetical protein